MNVCAGCVCVASFCVSSYSCVCFCVSLGFCVRASLFAHIPVWSCDVLFVCVSSEGKMVVLSLAIGLAEQDDFANLPDLQEAPASKENETTTEKR